MGIEEMEKMEDKYFLQLTKTVEEKNKIGIDHGFREVEKDCRINGLTYECCSCKRRHDVLVPGAYETIQMYCPTCEGGVREWKRVLPHPTIPVEEMSLYHRMNIMKALGIPKELGDTWYNRKLTPITPEEHQNLIKKFMDEDVKCEEKKVIEQKECPTCLNPILPEHKTHIDKSGIERHKGCAMGFHK